MKRILNTLLLLTAVVAFAAASPVSADQALARAKAYCGAAPAASSLHKVAAAPMRLAASTGAYYAFDVANGGGYVLLSADDEAVPVLACVERGSYDLAAMPDNMRWWLAEYTRQIEYAAAHPAKEGTVRYRLPQCENIAPLVSTCWDQNSPFNDECPKYNGQSCYLGCVAAAGAQIMNYNKWPEAAHGKKTYKWTVNGANNGTLTRTFDGHEYDWDKMLRVYERGYSEEAAKAVSTLCADLAYACEMQFSPDASGSGTVQLATALSTYFDYDCGMRIVMRDYTPLEQLYDLVFAELRAARPFYIAGMNADMGHAFVCDGYRDGLFHINWGWSGVSDGYFALSALEPNIQGAGGSDGGFSYNQEYLIGLQKPQEGSVCPIVTVCGSDFTVTPKNGGRSTGFNLSGYFIDYTIEEGRMLRYGVKFVDADGNATYLESNTSRKSSPSTFNNSFKLTTLGKLQLPDGEYKVYPAMKDEETGLWYDMQSRVNSISPYYMCKLSGSNVLWKVPVIEEAKLSATDIKPIVTPYAGYDFPLETVIANSGTEYLGNVYAVVAEQGSTVSITSGAKRLVNLTDGQSQKYELTVKAPAEPGDYDLLIVNEYGETVSAPQTFTVAEPPVGNPTVKMTKKINIHNSTAVAADDIQIDLTLRCTGGVYYGQLVGYIVPFGQSMSVSSIKSNVYIVNGESQTITVHGAFPSAEVGKKYTLIYYYWPNGVRTNMGPGANASADFTVGSLTSGITDVAADRKADSAVYDLMGRRHNETDLPAGIYVKGGKKFAVK